MKLPSAMLGFLLPSPYPGQLKNDWQCVTNTKKKAWFNEAEKKQMDENFNLILGLF